MKCRSNNIIYKLNRKHIEMYLKTILRKQSVFRLYYFRYIKHENRRTVV